jgi:hypothetical protein
MPANIDADVLLSVRRAATAAILVRRGPVPGLAPESVSGPGGDPLAHPVDSGKAGAFHQAIQMLWPGGPDLDAAPRKGRLVRSGSEHQSFRGFLTHSRGAARSTSFPRSLTHSGAARSTAPANCVCSREQFSAPWRACNARCCGPVNAGWRPTITVPLRRLRTTRTKSTAQSECRQHSAIRVSAASQNSFQSEWIPPG